MKKDFAYLDQYSILHVVDNVETAKQYSGNGKVEAVDIPNRGGYPLVLNSNEEEVEIVVYGKDEAYINGNRDQGNPIPLANYPEIEELYDRLI